MISEAGSWRQQQDIFWCEGFLLEKTNLLKMEIFWGMLISVDTFSAFFTKRVLYLGSWPRHQNPRVFINWFFRNMLVPGSPELSPSRPRPCSVWMDWEAQSPWELTAQTPTTKEPRQHSWLQKDGLSPWNVLLFLKKYSLYAPISKKIKIQLSEFHLDLWFLKSNNIFFFFFCGSRTMLPDQLQREMLP